MGMKLSHAFINVADLDAVVPFYTDVLGFHVTDRGTLRGDTEAVFMSQDPDNHHQIALANTMKDGDGTRNLAHIAFRLEFLDELRGLKKRLASEVVDVRREVSHGNTWSLYTPIRKAIASRASSIRRSMFASRRASRRISIWTTRRC